MVLLNFCENRDYEHYIASCKDTINKRLYRFNFAMITYLNDIKKEIFDFGNPYILFYERQMGKKIRIKT